ncbi:UNVERIFIED_CONTAM: amino acid adenylation domain-containing protein/non-ribosomal peptide synthase protein (TIGR01720 family), partial [Paenibacillus sp. PvR008]
YRTGDLARWMPDGNVDFIGRMDYQVKIRGYRIELGEIETAMLSFPGVLQAVVAPYAAASASGQYELCAYAVSENAVDAAGLRTHLAQRLPSHMVPAHIMGLERLPLTPNGKVDRRGLPQPDVSSRGDATYEAPRTPAEETLAGIWQTVLGVRSVSVHDDFFALGGDSIKALQVSSRLMQAGYRLDMKHLFRYPTVAELSPRVSLARRTANQSETAGPVSATPILRWFFEQAHDGAHHYNQALMFTRHGGFEEAALRQVVRKITEHHDALRLVVRRSADDQIELYNRGIREGDLFTLDVFDFTSLADPAAAIEVQANAIQSGIDLANGPLVKLGLFRCADSDHLLVAIHHLTVDGVSWRILMEDLASGYAQAVRGEPVRLPEKTDSFRVWAEQLAQFARSGVLEREKAYWEQIERLAVEPLPVDTDGGLSGSETEAESDAGSISAHTRSQVKDSRLAQIRLSPEETGQLLKSASNAYTTEVVDLLLTALARAVRRWSGLARVLVHLEGHGRENVLPEMDIARTVGWFTSLYPVVLEPGADDEIGRSIKQVKESLRAIPHKGVGYGILRYLSESSGSAPLTAHPDICFNYLGDFGQDYALSGLAKSPYALGEQVGSTTSLEHKLDINSMVEEDGLAIYIRYSCRMYRPETFQRFADLLKRSLQEVIAHCVAQERTELTPSDVQLPGMTASQLDRLTAETAELGEIENVFPLTPMQKGMLFHHLLESRFGAYFEQTNFDASGIFDAEAFRQSLDLVIQRHEALRTNFYSAWEEEPVQIVFRRRQGQLHYEDLRELGESEREVYAKTFADNDKARGMDPAKDSLLRVAVLRLSGDTYRFVWSSHHIILDGWCVSLLVKEIFGCYFALRKQEKPVLSPAAPYSRFIPWLQEQNPGEAAAFWQAYLHGSGERTALPGTYVCSSAPGRRAGYEAKRAGIRLGRALSGRLASAAKANHTTLYTLFQVVWGVLLQRYNGHRDVVFGSVVAGRPAHLADMERMIGLFINTIPVRVRSEPGDTFVKLMRRSQDHALAAQPYLSFPLYEIQQMTEWKQDLINHLVAFENFPMDQLIERIGLGDDGDLAISNITISEQTNYDLNLTVFPGEDMDIHISYNALVFEDSAIARIGRQLRFALEQVASNPELTVDALQLADEAEQLTIRTEFNDTTADYPRGATIHRIFNEQARRTPDQTAVACGTETLTYRELNARANRLARKLQAAGARPNMLVALIADRSLDMIVGVLGILKSGAAYLPIDPDYPSERIGYMLDDSKAQILVVQDHLQERVAFGGTAILLDKPGELSCPDDERNPEPSAGPEHLAYVIYTSGTTGKPKGTLIEHRHVARLLFNSRNRFNFHAADTWTLFHSFCFDFSIWEMYGALLNGGKLVVVPKRIAQDPKSFLALLAASGVTVLNQTPSAFYQLAQAEENAGGGLASLRYVIFGGESLAAVKLLDVKRKYPQIRFINMYGITEITVHATYKELDGRDMEAASNNIGRPIPTTSIYIADFSGNLAPVGLPGEMYVGGEGVARGYLNRPDLTAERFVERPFAPGVRLYKTGDLARWKDNGELEYMGRADHQVKIRGYRIELGEVETVLCQTLVVEEAVVLAKADEEGHFSLCAYYVSAESYTPAQLRQALSGRLPDYMIPSHLIQLETLPLTSNGKVDRKALPEPGEAGAAAVSGLDFVMPCNELERQLADVWMKVLGLKTVSVHEDFFNLGGDSMKAVRIASKSGGQVSVADIFEGRTIERLAVIMEHHYQARTAKLVTLHTPSEAAEPAGMLVCVPYGGGSSMSYRKLADQMKLEDGPSLLAVELPEPSVAPGLSVWEAARQCAGQLPVETSGPVVVYGHCAGSAIAIEIVQLLEERGITVEALWIGGSLLMPDETEPENVDDQTVYQFMKDIRFQFEMTFEEAGYLIKRFRRDGVISGEYFNKTLQDEARRRIKAPLYCAIGEDDWITAEYLSQYGNWKLFADQVELRVIPGAGHYFNETHAEALAAFLSRSRSERQAEGT